MTPLGLGTDLGGSLRFPSQCCGTAALRPTLGRVAQAASIEPADPPFGMQLMSVVGPMARRVDDLRAAFEVLRRPSDRDPWYAPVEADRPGGPARVAVVTGQDTHPGVAAGVRRAADALAGAGYQVEELDPPALQDATTIWLTVVGHDLGLIWPVLEAVASKDAIGFLTAALAAGPPTDPAAATHALVARHGLARAWAAFQRSHPLILGPVSTQPPFPAGADLGGTEAAGRILGSLSLTIAANVLGLPAAAVPVGLAGGLPQGVQLIGPRWREDLCLDAAATVEAAAGILTPIDPR
jgi:amidase